MGLRERRTLIWVDDSVRQEALSATTFDFGSLAEGNAHFGGAFAGYGSLGYLITG
jgi:hypothetical protein